MSTMYIDISTHPYISTHSCFAVATFNVLAANRYEARERYNREKLNYERWSNERTIMTGIYE